MVQFEIPNFGLVSTPTNPREWDLLSRDECPESKEGRADAAKMPCKQLIRSMMYLMVGTRPDLAHSLSVLSGYLINPGRPHYNAALRCWHIYWATLQVGLWYVGEELGTSPKLTGTCDASFACHEDGTSQGGYYFTLCGGAISWKSYKIKKIVLSSTEVEYVMISDAARQAEYH